MGRFMRRQAGTRSCSSSMTTLHSPRRSFSVISSEEASELEWFDPEILSNNGTVGLINSPRSMSTEFLFMQAAHVNGCPCPASKMIPYYEERLSQMQTEIDTLKGLIPKNRIISLEDHPSYPSEDDYGALTAICTLLNEICVTGIMFQLEFTTAILTALSSDDDKRVEALYLDSDR